MRYGKRATVEETIRENVELVRALVKAHYPMGALTYGATTDDLVQMGVFGLAVAHAQFVEARAGWTTLVKYRVLDAIRDGLLDYGHSRRPSANSRRRPMRSISQFGDGSGDDAPIEQITHATPMDAAMLADQVTTLRAVLGSMPKRFATILRMRFLEGRLQKEIGAHLGLTESRIAQLEPQALAMARRKMAFRESPTKRRVRIRLRTRFTDAQRRQIVSDYLDSDMTMMQVGKKWGLVTTSVYQIVAGPIAVRLFGEHKALVHARLTKEKRGRLIRAAKTRVSREDIERIRDRFRAGARVTDLAREYAVRRETMGCMIYGRGVYTFGNAVPKPGGKRKLTFVQAEEIRRRYLAGAETMYDIATAFSTSYATVRAILRGKAYQTVPGLPGKPGTNAPSTLAQANAALGLPADETRKTASLRMWRRTRKRKAA